MSDKRNVLIVGATGMLGRLIAYELLKNEDCNVRAMVRKGESTGKKAELLRQFQRDGIELIEGDLLNPDSLPPACEGVYAIISAVQGGPNVMVDGQGNLIDAADKAGVKRMIPSDFSVDLHKLDYDDHVWLALRKRANDEFEGKSINPISVLNGAFMDTTINPILGLANWEEGYFTYWGDGETPCDFTRIPDTAKYTAAVAVDQDFTGRSLKIAGDVLTMKELHKLFEEFVGKPLELRNAGSVDDLKSLIEETKKSDPANDIAYAFYQYQWAMVSGIGKLNPLDNERYPEIKPMSFEEFLTTNPDTSGGTGSTP